MNRRVATVPERRIIPARANRSIEHNLANLGQRNRQRLPDPNPQPIVRFGLVASRDLAAGTVNIEDGPNRVPFYDMGAGLEPRVGDQVIYADNGRNPVVLNYRTDDLFGGNNFAGEWEVATLSETVNSAKTATHGFISLGSGDTYTPPGTWDDYGLIPLAVHLDNSISGSGSYYAACRLDIDGTNASTRYRALSNHRTSGTSNTMQCDTNDVYGLNGAVTVQMEGWLGQVSGTFTWGNWRATILARREHP